MSKPTSQSKAQWMAELERPCSKCGHRASPVYGVAPFDGKGLCYFCRNGIKPTPLPKRRTVRP